ncbi:hypothetical protein FGM00_04010 [Aggregatimonas sangjinii]|uniref:Uncharacterized protein n=1 Tax=Aggregatimonas sangjinii TaxID=2583587 RepID=A0A5B7SL98_9FLAO|nr:hypothetical protein [Aggregatimonas sangjinii]QCW99315.1 hypothetical protein FGM00_04010 [Aggregatimonas sangjinii]
MKKVFLTLSILPVVILFGCNNPDNALGILDPDSTNKKHLEYFGFTLVDTLWDDPTDADSKTNYSDEVAPFSNLADILVVDPTDNVIARMERMQHLQMKSILHIAALFFEIEGTNAPSGTDYKLRNDYRERWMTFVNTNQLTENQGFVQALYLGEEPVWNGVSANELRLAADYISNTTPEYKVMVIEAYPVLDELQLPNSVDWVGFDHYFIENPAKDPTFLGELGTLKAKLKDNQQLVLVMDAHYIDFAHGGFGGIALDKMGEVANSYYELAKAESKAVTLLGYFWPSGFDHAQSIGARNMPDNVKDEYVRIGKEITGKH